MEEPCKSCEHNKEEAGCALTRCILDTKPAMDSAGTPIRRGDRVRFRGREYTIKGFVEGEGSYGTAKIVFEEKEVHTFEVPCETNVDLIEKKFNTSGTQTGRFRSDVPNTSNPPKDRDPLGRGDERPQKGMWAPGTYMCTCSSCKSQFIGAKRALTCANCAYAPDRAVLWEDETVTIDNVILPAKANLEFTTTEWDKIIEYYPEYKKHCRRQGIAPMDTLAYVLAFCRKLEEAKIERDGEPRTAESWFRRIPDHFGREWFNDEVLGSAAPYLSGF